MNRRSISRQNSFGANRISSPRSTTFPMRWQLSVRSRRCRKFRGNHRQGNIEMKGPRKPNLAFLLIMAVSTLMAAGPGLTKALFAKADQESGGAAGVPTLDFETYRTRVEPIFLKQRQDGGRCYDCH